MNVLVWFLIGFTGVLISAPIIRSLRKHVRTKQIAKRNLTLVDPVPDVPRGTSITEPMCVWSVWSGEDRIAGPMAYKDAHNVARMYAVEWCISHADWFPIQVRDDIGEVACSYSVDRALNVRAVDAGV